MDVKKIAFFKKPSEKDKHTEEFKASPRLLFRIFTYLSITNPSENKFVSIQYIRTWMNKFDNYHPVCLRTIPSEKKTAFLIGKTRRDDQKEFQKMPGASVQIRM